MQAIQYRQYNYRKISRKYFDQDAAEEENRPKCSNTQYAKCHLSYMYHVSYNQDNLRNQIYFFLSIQSSTILSVLINFHTSWMNFRWRGWKLQNQVLSIFLLQSLALIITLLSIDAYSYSLITQIFTENSKALMIKQNNQQTKQSQYHTVKNVSLILNQSFKQIVNANYLFQYSIGLDYQYIQQPFDCLTNRKSLDKYSYSSSLCYGSYGAREYSTQDYQFFNYTALTTTILPLYDGFTFYYAQTKDNYYFAQNPGQNLTNWNIHLRPWYVRYLKRNDSSLTAFTTPYLSSVGGYLIAESTGLKYENGTNFAIFGHPLRILNIFQTIQQNMNVTIVDKNGLIYTVGNQNDNQIYLKNQSYTGFDQNQQDQILASINAQSIILYNSKLQLNVSIGVRSLGRTGLLLIFQSNPLYEQDKIHQHLIEISDIIIQTQYKVTLIWICVTVLLIAISIVTLIINLRPFKHLELLMQNNYKQQNFKTLKRMQLLHTSSISQLQTIYTSYNTMVQNITGSKSINTEVIKINSLIEYLQDHQQIRIKALIKYLNSRLIFSLLKPEIITRYQ